MTIELAAVATIAGDAEIDHAIATLVLATKYHRPALVWLGVSIAFGLQTLIAVALGKVVSFLPTDPVRVAAMLMFLVGAFLLYRQARDADANEQETEDEYSAKAADVHGLRIVLTSFLVLFAAEWGDLSQLLTLSLVAKYDDHLSVFIGAWGALLAVSGLACVMGRVLLSRMRLSTLHYVGSAVCLLLFVVTMVELV